MSVSGSSSHFAVATRLAGAGSTPDVTPVLLATSSNPVLNCIIIMWWGRRVDSQVSKEVAMGQGGREAGGRRGGTAAPGAAAGRSSSQLGAGEGGPP